MNPKTGQKKEVYAVPAVALSTPGGKKLIPNPAGNDAAVYDTLEDAAEAIARAGFDYMFEGKKTVTLGSQGPKRLVVPNTGDPLANAVPLLIACLSEKESSVIANSAFALGVLEDSAAVEPLCALLGHEDSVVRKNVAEALAKIGANALWALRDNFDKALQSKEKNAPYIRLTVMTAYLELSHTHRELLDIVLPQAVEALQDESWLVRAQAASVIGHAAPFLYREE